MLSFHSRKHRHTTGEVVLIFDIGSGSVGAALALISLSHKPILLAAERAEMPFQDTIRAKRLQPLMLRALSQATLSLLAEGIPRVGLAARHLKVAGALFVLAAPWCSPRTETLTLSQKEPITITEDVISTLVQHADGENEKVLGSPDVPRRSLPQSEEQCERILLSARLNGYETGMPIGKSARTASFSFFQSSAPRALLRAIGDTVAHFVHLRRIRFHSYALSAFCALRELLSNTENFLFLDIGGEMTEAVIVREGELQEVFSFPVGRNHLIRALAKGTHSSPSAATGILALSREEIVHPEKSGLTASLLNSFRDSWLSELGQAAAHFSDTPSLPETTYLSGDDDCAELFAGFVRMRVPAGGASPSEAAPAVSILRADTFLSRLTTSTGSAADSFLMLETVYASQLQQRNALFA